MFKLLKIVAKAGDVTTRYPFAPFPVSPGFRGKPELDPVQCMACGACTIACPANALTMETQPESGQRTWALDLGRCIFCGRCEENCPTHAIVLTPEFELAVARKEDMMQRASFRLQNCVSCNKPFAPEKEVAYVQALLQEAMPMDKYTLKRIESCPECKRRSTLTRDAASLHLYEEARS